MFTLSSSLAANVKSIAVSADIHCTSAPLMYNSQKEFASSANVFQPALKQYAVVRRFAKQINY